MDVSALKKQSPLAALTDPVAQPTATDEFLNVFRKHLSAGGTAAAANGLSDPSKALFAADRDQAEIVLPEPERPETRPKPAKGADRPRERQPSEGRGQDEAEAPAEEAAAAPQQAAQQPRPAQKGRKTEENADTQAAPVVEDKVLPEEAAAIIMLVAPAQVADQGMEDRGAAMVQAADAEAIVAPQAVEGEGQQAAKPAEKAPSFTPAAEIARDVVEAQPAQAAAAAAAAAPTAQRRKIEFETGSQEWLEEPIQVTVADGADLPAAQVARANANAQDLIVAMNAGQDDTADFAPVPQFAAPAAPVEGGQPTASAAAATRNDAALAAEAMADATTAAPIMPVMATAAADAGSAHAAAKPAVEAPTQIGGASATQGASGTDKAKAPAAPPPARAVPPKELVPEIKAQVVKAVADGVDRINIKMRPEQLGRIEIRLEVGQDGRLTAMFTAENKDTLQMLQRDARDLHKAFQEAGLSTDSNSLTFNLSGRQGDQQEAGNQPKGGKARVGDIEAEIAEKAVPERRPGRSRGVDISV